VPQIGLKNNIIGKGIVGRSVRNNMNHKRVMEGCMKEDVLERNLELAQKARMIPERAK
jgi:hypothetical protein